jgi:hypothetical protein
MLDTLNKAKGKLQKYSGRTLAKYGQPWVHAKEQVLHVPSSWCTIAGHNIMILNMTARSSSPKCRYSVQSTQTRWTCVVVCIGPSHFVDPNPND